MKLIIVSPEKNHPKEFDVYNAVYNHPKLAHIHIRKKNDIKIDWESLKNMAQKLVISQNLSAPIQCLGVHGKSSSFSESAHSLIEATNSKAQFCYIGPIYPSISKKGYENNQLLSEIKKLNDIPKHWVALGGIDFDKIEALKNLGFKTIAVLGGVWQNNEPKDTALKILNAL